MGTEDFDRPIRRRAAGLASLGEASWIPRAPLEAQQAELVVPPFMPEFTLGPCQHLETEDLVEPAPVVLLISGFRYLGTHPCVTMWIRFGVQGRAYATFAPVRKKQKFLMKGAPVTITPNESWRFCITNLLPKPWKGRVRVIVTMGRMIA